jgi:hypothetical protein
MTVRETMLTNLQDNLTGIDDPHAPATLLKNWFRQLEQALIPDNVYDECVKIGQMEDRAEARNVAWKMIDGLPRAHGATIRQLVTFLQPVIENSSKTMMQVNSICIVLTPCVLRCPSTESKILLTNYRFEQSFLRLLLENE